ncbi:MAG: hypothetical protein P0Y53_01730 [Candidatus Pseudobacter hemicellulosilyticus]|uniref:ABC3 transporter permease C-terminal domain-containing protein n=1 Tax=Candidatus Pseudobacter hemicellulosilyticus TaxID=3121375 RepID=A0AAJ5WV79_9BACT|nr:MAG: hypothetical protein P0Y53_01730 [Pseudobacter sp.]
MASFHPIRPLLQTGTNISSRLFSYLGLGIGVLLLLCSIQMYINIQQLLGEESPRKDGYDFISISKTITNETMGQLEKNLFNEQEIRELEAKPFIQGVSPLLANNFRFQLSGGSLIPFMSDFFVESLENNFIDTVPPTFHWQEGQTEVPIIFSSDFLEIYNVFAPGYGLPQISEATATQVSLQLICYYPDGRREYFRGRVVALSDRINSIIVPRQFLDWANNRFGTADITRASRLYIKTKDANGPDFLNYLQEKDYKVNKDKTKFGRVKQVMQGIFSGLGIFGLLVVVMALMLFSFYLQLMIARSKDSLQLLLLLGYSPGWLSRHVSRQFIPIYFTVVLIAAAITQLLQWLFHRFAFYSRPELDTPLHWSVWVTALILILLSIVTNHRMVRRLLYRLY